MARPLREQLKERINEHMKRQNQVEAIKGEHLRTAPWTEAVDEGEDPRPSTQLAGGYAPGSDAPLPPGALMPRVAALEDVQHSHQVRLAQCEAIQMTTDQRLAQAIARLAGLVGVNATDLGL